MRLPNPDVLMNREEVIIIGKHPEAKHIRDGVGNRLVHKRRIGTYAHRILQSPLRYSHHHILETIPLEKRHPGLAPQG